VPGCTIEETFAGRPAAFRAIYDVLIEHVTALGPVHLDVVRVGVFLKHERKFAEIRPKARSLSVALVLPRLVADSRIARTIHTSSEWTWHFVKLVDMRDFDDQVRDWLTEAYDAAGG
jgi:hypothetical protein